MSRPHRTRHRRGALGRFAAALAALVAVVVGIPAGLVVLSRLGLDAVHPFPAIGTGEEIRSYLDRELSTAEITPIAIRALLIVAWLLWAAMVASIVASLLEARGSRSALPKFGMFAGLGRWIAAGLTAFSALTPSFVSAARLESPRPFTVSSRVPTATVQAERQVPAGFARVVQGESPETFAQRTLGNPARWTEIWELNKQQPVGADGEVWAQAWRIHAGWDLRLPTAPATPSAESRLARESTLARILDRDHEAPTSVPVAAEVAGEHTAGPGDSYWSIAEAQLGDGASGAEVRAQMQLLMDVNAPRLGYADPGMLQPGDVVTLVVQSDTAALSAAVDTATGEVADVPQVVVEAGDSYWEVAEDELGPDAAGSEVLELTQDLIDLNNPILQAGDPDGDRNYDEDRRMIHPGDVLYLADPAAAPTVDTPAAPPLPAALPPPVVAAPVDTGPSREEQLLELAAQREAAETAAAEVDQPVVEQEDAGSVVSFAQLAGVTSIAAVGVGGMFVARRRRASRGRPHERPVGLPGKQHALARAVLSADVADVTWMGMELCLLARQCSPELRRSLEVEEVQIGAGRGLELAFAHTPLSEPPAGWTMVAERIWRLDQEHSAEELEPFADKPPLLPALVTLGRFDGGELFVNLENKPINVSGERVAVDEWVTSVVWEFASGGIAERPTVLLVDAHVPGVAQLADSVKTLEAESALAWCQILPAAPEGPMINRRADFEAWDPTLVVLGAGVDTSAWSDVAARGDVAVIALHGALTTGLSVVIAEGRVEIPSWNVAMDAVGMPVESAGELADLLEAAASPVVPDDLSIAPIDVAQADEVAGPYTNPLLTEQDADVVETGWEPDPDDVAPIDEWTPPKAEITARLLGVPGVSGPHGEIHLSPQQMAAVAFLAVEREATLDEFQSAIWGDDVEVKDHRVRDLLSELRKVLAVDNVVAKVENRIVRAGPALGCDLDVFAALTERARSEPAEAAYRLRQAVDLVDSRPFNYQRSVSEFWRWADLSQQHAIWEHRIATAAFELAQWHLQANDPVAAIQAAKQGLQADALNSALTEVVIEAFAAEGSLEAALRVYQSHDRAMSDAGFGGASDETRAVIESIYSSRRTDSTTATASI